MPANPPPDPSSVDRRWPGVTFTPTERAVLAYLLSAGARTVPTGELLREVWGYDPNTRTRTVQTTISRLRRKIEADPARPEVLRTLRGHGYQLLISEDGRADDAPPRLTDDSSAFVGRRADLDALDALFAAGARLITVQGAGGLGKTRLARRFAATRAPDGGAWFCDLSEARTADDLLGTVGEALGVLRGPGTSAAAPIAHVLSRRGPCLLVLDNFEQLPAEAASALGELVAAAPDLVVLVTSRSRLGLAAERVHELDSLPGDDAVALLRDRIRAVRGERATLDSAALAGVAALLEGVPLALEMAAARTRVLPLPALRDRLRASFDLLRLDRPGAPRRQHTLQDAFLWSWRLMSPDTRRALARLCVFRGGATVEAADAVLGPDDDAVTALDGLLDRSVVRAWSAPGGRRFGPYESVRRYALEAWDGDLHDARARHATWAVSYARRWADAVDADPEAGPALRREIDNLVAAHRWLLTEGDPAAVDLVCDLWPAHAFGPLHGRYVGLLRDTRARMTPSGPAAARLHERLAWALRYRGDVDGAVAEVERGLSAVGDAEPARASLLSCAARLALDRGRIQEAHDHAVAAVALAERHDLHRLLPFLLNDLAATLDHLGAPDDAVTTCRRAIAVAEDHRLERGAAILWKNLGDVYARAGDPDRGADCLRRARQLAERFDDRIALHGILASLAVHHARRGDLSEADALFRRLLDDEDRFGGRAVRGANRVNAAIVAVLVGDAARGDRLLGDVLGRLDGARGADSVRHLCRAWRVVACVDLDDLEGAERSAKPLIPAPEDGHPDEIALCLGHLDILRSRRARRSGRPDDARRHRDAAAACLAAHPDAEATDAALPARRLARALALLDAETSPPL